MVFKGSLCVVLQSNWTKQLICEVTISISLLYHPHTIKPWRQIENEGGSEGAFWETLCKLSNKNITAAYIWDKFCCIQPETAKALRSSHVQMCHSGMYSGIHTRGEGQETWAIDCWWMPCIFYHSYMYSYSSKYIVIDLDIWWYIPYKHNSTPR